MGVLGWVALGVGALLVFLIGQVVHLAAVLSWEQEKTRGLGYYGLPPDGRDSFKRTLRRHARLLYPILRLVGRFSQFTFERASFRHDDITGPRGTCSEASFAQADTYRARPDDVFVATQMKCGTTWMQHVVYQVLTRGAGDLVESGRTLYAVSPWLEADKSVPMAESPLVGSERPSRIIKTHMPVQHCPYDRAARYVYVARHPVSCFASCADFVATNIGTLAPELAAVERWFCSPELMWWGTWTDHVNGWWDLAQRESNVLFVHFEEMKRDLPGVAQRVATFVGVSALDKSEIERVVHKCSFSYMQQHKTTFEMNPPHLLQTDAELFVRGTADRHEDVPAEVRRRVAAWCVQLMQGSDYPLLERYPDLTD